MPREICQETNLKENKITSLCDDCSSKDGCSEAYALSLIDRGKGATEGKRHIIVECDSHVSLTGSFSSKSGHAKMALFIAEITDLCEGCPTSEKQGCAYRSQLRGLVQVGINRGEWLKPVVVDCTTVLEGNDCKKLWQISEPNR